MTTPLERATREVLRSGAESLEGRVRSRLNRARQQALDEMLPEGRWARKPLLPWAAAVSAAAVAVLLLLPSTVRPPVSPTEPVVAAIDDAELLGVGGGGLLDEDPTLFALAAADEVEP